MLVNVNIVFLHTNPKKIFNLQSTYTFSAKYENFLLLALSQAMWPEADGRTEGDEG